MADNHEKEVSKNILHGNIYTDHRWDGTDFTTINDKPIDKMHVAASEEVEFEYKLYQLDSDLNQKGASSFDSIFSPYSTYFSASGFPAFEVPKNKTDPNSLTLNPFNPNNALSLYYAPTGSLLYQASLAKSGSPTAAELAFSQTDTTSPIGQERGDLRKGKPEGWMDSGHSIYMAINGTGNRYSAEFEEQFTESSGYDVEVTNIRGVGLRSPMVLTGWGFDVLDKPVPADVGNSKVFASGAFSDPSIWKSGPLDVRWDDDRKVWTPPNTKIYLVKTTNSYNPSCFSYEVQRSDSRAQYTRDTLSRKAFSATDPIHDPEYLAYTADSDNKGCFGRLDFDGQEYPHYEAFIIRETVNSTDSNPYYNIWTDDCHDCGHVTSSCGTQHGSDSTGKKILIENPLRQSLNVGDLAFTVKTGRKEKVNSGSFSGGTGTGASAKLVTDSDGNMSAELTEPGTGYSHGGFAIITGDICTNVSLTFVAGALTTITVSPTSGFDASTTYPLTIYPNDTTADTEELDVHWILQAEFKSQQVTTHVECNGGILQTCTTKIQTQGFKSCEWCGEDLTLVNNFI